MNRRQFLTGLTATTAGLLVPSLVAAEPERRVWALDRTMVKPASHSVLQTCWFDTQLHPDLNRKLFALGPEVVFKNGAFVVRWVPTNELYWKRMAHKKALEGTLIYGTAKDRLA